MSSLPEPTERSPGFVRLKINHGYRESHVGLRLHWGVDLTQPNIVAPEVTAVAAALADILPPSCTVVGWDWLNIHREQLYEVVFDFVLTGTHGTNPGEPKPRSRYLCITGEATEGTIGEKKGQARLFVFCENAYVPDGVGNDILRTTDVELDTFCDVLLAQPSLWCDFYGWKANVRNSVKLGYNDLIRKHFGN